MPIDNIKHSHLKGGCNEDAVNANKMEQSPVETYGMLRSRSRSKLICEECDPHQRKIILATISGADRPGVTASLMEILGDHDAFILDMGQADIHNILNLGILFETTEEKSGSILKELLFRSYELDVQIRFSPICEEDYNVWVKAQGKNRFIITVVAPKMTAQMLASISKEVADQGLNIDNIRRLTGRIPLDSDERTPMSSIEFSVRGNPTSVNGLQDRLLKLSSELMMDISFQRDSMYRRMRRLICFDMDSTLIQAEVIDELARANGVYDKVQAITERAMRGEIDFKESFIERVALLKGMDASQAHTIAENLPMTDGIDRLMPTLKIMGYKIAILSGGFMYFGRYLQKKFGIDYVYANQLEVGPDGKLTGRHIGDIVDAERKAELLKLIAQVENVHLMQTVAVGDGANDLQMLRTAGLGIAFHAKPKVKEQAKQSLSHVGLDGILYFLGYKDSYYETTQKKEITSI